MPNAFSREEKVAFDRQLEGFNDALAFVKNIEIYRTDQTTMARTNDIIWRPMRYIVPSYTGIDQTANFNDKTQLSVPSTIGFRQSVPIQMDANELRDALQEGRLGEAARVELASFINRSALNLASQQGSLTVKRTVAATGLDDVAQADALMNEGGVPGGVLDGRGMRCLALSTRDYNGMASSLQAVTRSFGNRKSDRAYEEGYVGPVLDFETYKLDYANRLTAALGVGVTINEASAANRRYVPRATSTAGTGEVQNVDNRYMTITVAVTSGTYKVNDRFTIAGVNNVHAITKQDTGQPKTFVVTRIVSGGGGAGVMEFSPPIIAADSTPTQAEIQYKNCTATPANGAALTFLNTAAAAANPFWHKSAIELLPGRYAVPSDAGMSVMRATTDQGIEVVMTKQASINNLLVKYRWDVVFGLVMNNPEMAGTMLFNQT
jgi:hypothetical protein